MKNSTVLILLATLTATILLFTGCGKEADTEPVVSEAVETEVVEEVEAIEETQPVEKFEPAEPVEEEPVAEDVPLTQEEIDELKSTGDSAFQMALDAYEAITSGGTYTLGGTTYTKVVGTPNEDGWCTSDDLKGIIYFDYDAWYADATANPIPKNDPPELVESDDEYWSSID